MAWKKGKEPCALLEGTLTNIGTVENSMEASQKN